MRKNENGFSHVELVVLFLIVAVIGFVGWRVYDSREKNQGDTSEQSTQNSGTTNKVETSTPEKKEYMTVTRGEYALYAPDDVEKLPKGTPESFKTFMSEKLKDNGPDEYGCRDKYTITVISPVNVKGNYSYEDMSGEGCGSGAGPMWALTPDGTWDETAGHEYADCTTENGGKVYEEFAAECFANRDGSDPVKNPNGSVTKLVVQ